MKERLNLYFKHLMATQGLKKNISAFQKEIGLGNGYFSKTVTPSVDVGKKIKKALPGLNYDWLVSGEGDMLANKKEKPSEIHDFNSYLLNIKNHPKSKVVPALDCDFAAGLALSLIEVREGVIRPMALLAIPEVQECDVIVRVAGDSMSDEINDRDWIGIKQLHNWNEWFAKGHIYAIVTPEQKLVKRVLAGEDKDHFIIRSTNPKYPDDPIPKNIILEMWEVKVVIPFSKMKNFL